MSEPETEIDGAALLDEARRFLARFLVPSSPAVLDVMTLWACHTWVTDAQTGELAWRVTPRIAFVSDEPKSGKTAHLEMMGLLCRNFELISDTTGPAMGKAIAERHPVFGLDEADLLFGKGAAARSVRTVLNSGYRAGNGIDRVSGRMDTFAPAAVAGLASSLMANESLSAMRSRCVIIQCHPPEPGVHPERYREQLHEGLGKMAGAALGKWAEAKAAELVTCWPDLDERLDGRQMDLWEVLTAVADTAGGEWPAKARAACLEFTIGQRERVPGEGPVLPPRLRLLADIRAVWPEGADRMTSAALVEALRSLEGAPWAPMWSPVAAAREIPALLGVAPVKIKADGRALQGWYLSQVEPMWADLPGQDR